MSSVRFASFLSFHVSVKFHPFYLCSIFVAFLSRTFDVFFFTLIILSHFHICFTCFSVLNCYRICFVVFITSYHCFTFELRCIRTEPMKIKFTIFYH